ncbi:30S ribosomal protein S16 [bacterium]|nr:30S ribosomal protein S16 [bacterium]
MAVSIRLTRMGRKKKPFYRIVVMDSRKKRDGKFIERLGVYNPLVNPAVVEIDDEKAMKWLNDGAIPSDTVKNLFSRKGIMLKFDMAKKGFSEEKMQEEIQKWEMQKAERQKRLEAEANQKAADKQKKSAVKVEEAKAEETESAPEKGTEVAE